MKTTTKLRTEFRLACLFELLVTKAITTEKYAEEIEKMTSDYAVTRDYITTN